MSGPKVLAVIPARGGSKGVPGKNVRLLAGHPLLAWTIAVAHRSPAIQRTILSSDDPAIIAVAQRYGCQVPFVRPAELAGDQISATAAALHALEWLSESYDYLMLLQPTSPLRQSADLEAALALCLEHEVPACIGVCAVSKSPHWMVTLDEQGRMTPLLQESSAWQRQQLPPVYVPNGAVYIARCDWLRHHRSFVSPASRAYIMPAERSLDIDTELDFILAEKMVNHFQLAPPQPVAESSPAPGKESDDAH